MKKSITIALAAIVYFTAIAGAQDSTHVDKKVNVSPTISNYPPPPPPPPPPMDNDSTEFIEEFPLFPGCNDITGSYDDKKKCSDYEMRKYLVQKAGYPKEAREAGIEGKVFVRFVVMPDGTISKVEVAKDLTDGRGGLAEASLKAVESMNELEKRWTPGKQKGEPVAVRIMMPFVFKLNEPDEEEPKKKKRGRK